MSQSVFRCRSIRAPKLMSIPSRLDRHGRREAVWMTNERLGDSDWVLAIEAKEGSATALAKIARRWWAPIYRFAWNMSANASFAAEVTERTVLAAIRSGESTSARYPFRVFVYRLALRWTATPQKPVTNPQQGTDSVSAVREALARLSPLERAAVVLREIEQLGTAEVAAILEIPSAEIQMRVHRAVAFLARSAEKTFGADASTLRG
jgi:DNA-directed RNA polymerase specialized sigma24 family protein